MNFYLGRMEKSIKFFLIQFFNGVLLLFGIAVSSFVDCNVEIEVYDNFALDLLKNCQLKKNFLDLNFHVTKLRD